MALCHRQCPQCVNRVTVLIEGQEQCDGADMHLVDAQHTAKITAIYEQMLEEAGDVNDIAIILRMDGVDIAAKCSRLSGLDDECILF